MSWLLDVNFILASRWTTHPDHLAAKAWVDSTSEFYTCAITEQSQIQDEEINCRKTKTTAEPD